MTQQTVLTDKQISAIADVVHLSGFDLDDIPDEIILELSRAVERATLQSPEVQALRDVLERCRFALEPYDDIKPRDWVTDRERLRRAHEVARTALAAMEKQK